MTPLTNTNKQSSAFKIDECIVNKITLMAYHLSPHPLATLIKESVSYKCWGATLCVLNHYDFLDDVEWKYLKEKDFEEELCIEIKFFPDTRDGLKKADFIIRLQDYEYNDVDDAEEKMYIEIKQRRAWKKNSQFDKYVNWLIKYNVPFWDLKN